MPTIVVSKVFALLEEYGSPEKFYFLPHPVNFDKPDLKVSRCFLHRRHLALDSDFLRRFEAKKAQEGDHCLGIKAGPFRFLRSQEFLRV